MKLAVLCVETLAQAKVAIGGGGDMTALVPALYFWKPIVGFSRNGSSLVVWV